MTTRLGERKAHPGVAIERDSRAAFLAGMKQVDFLLWLAKGPQPTPASDRIARQRWLDKVAPLRG